MVFRCRTPRRNAGGLIGVLVVGIVLYAAPSGVVIGAQSFGVGLLAVGGALGLLEIFRN